MNKIACIATLSLIVSLHVLAKKPAEVAGCWTTSGIKGDYLKLSGDGSFSFSDNVAKKQTILKGNWKLHKNTLTLKYESRPEQTFRVIRDKQGNIILKEGGYLFKRIDNGSCEG